MRVFFKGVITLVLLLSGLVFYWHRCPLNSKIMRDLIFIRNKIQANHPGVFNQQDPTFNQHLEYEFCRACAAISENVLIKNQQKIIEDFAKSFNDKHLWVSWTDTTELSLQEKKILQLSKICIDYLECSIPWVRLPTFIFDQTQQQHFEALLKQLPSFINKPAIIFDLSGNRGGSSFFAKQILVALFGRDYVNSKLERAEAKVSVDWRASKDNLTHLKSLRQTLSYRENFEFKNWLDLVIAGMKASLTENKPYFNEVPKKLSKSSSSYELKHSVMAKIIVIIDQCNVSAALDFIDMLKIIDYPVLLVGKTTAADRLYMEVCTVDLPSGLGAFSFPIKVYRNRVRGDNEPYRPEIECVSNSVEQLKLIVQKIIGEN